jgi:ornithine decarboxylase
MNDHPLLHTDSLHTVRRILLTNPRLRTPVLLIDRDAVDERLREFRDAIPRAQVHYAVKANSSPMLLRHLAARGSGFDVASAAELYLIHRELGVAPERIVFSNPIKNEDDLRMIELARPRAIAIESEHGLDQLLQRGILGADYQPVLFVRKPVPGSNLDKYGSAEEVGPLLKRAKEKAPACRLGVTFHVGTQSTDAATFERQLKECRQLIDQLAQQGVGIDIVNCGGGLPDQRTAKEKSANYRGLLAEIGTALDKHLLPTTEVFIEPGRSLVADAGVIVTKVMARTETVEGSQSVVRLTIDDSLFGNLLGQWHDDRKWVLEPFTRDASDSLPPPDPRPCIVYGNSCDGKDRIGDKHTLPQDIAVGTLLLIQCAGAYTTVTATTFNSRQRSDVVLYRATGDQPICEIESPPRPWDDLKDSPPGGG